MIRTAEPSDRNTYRQLGNLAALLIDAVAGGASVSFTAAITHAEAEAFWEEAIRRHPCGPHHPDYSLTTDG